ncbi:uncharacterized protein UBRO_20298 [Ustilago bromivora]|uniref:Uncharacterized protein n=1 Tax=Ustilago bromivora TaxID=307758 RepID=A0A1K0HFV2_9BASI|nr:uncharacterized protein UBRO_20298 [Ustilago bromivora]
MHVPRSLGDSAFSHAKHYANATKASERQVRSSGQSKHRSGLARLTDPHTFSRTTFTLAGFDHSPLDQTTFRCHRRGLRNDIAPRLDLSTLGAGHAALVAETITDAYHCCKPDKRVDFAKRWIDRGDFLKERQGTLVFHTMTGAQTTTAT